MLVGNIKKKIICISTILSLLCSCGSGSVEENGSKSKEISGGDEIVFTGYDEKVGDNIPIIRGEVAKIVALTFCQKDQIYNSSDQIKFEDIDSKDVYYKYINASVNSQYFEVEDGFFRAYDNMSLEEAETLLKKINPNGQINLDITEENKNKPVSYGLFVDLFTKTLAELSGGQVYSKFGLIQTTPIVLATNKDNRDLNQYIITDNGKLKATNMDLSAYRDTEIDIYEKDNEIVMLRAFVTKTPTIENALLCSYDESKITLFAGGVYRDYKIINGSANDIQRSICNVKIDGTTAQSVYVNKNSHKETVRQIDNSQIKLSDNNTYEFDENFKVYGDYATTLTFENKKDIRVGSTANFITKDNKILSCVFDEEVYPSRIRVILNDSSFQNTTHKKVVISSTNGFTLNDKQYKSGESIEINEDNYTDYIKDDYVKIEPIDNGKIIVNSIQRANGYSPAYRGFIEICKVSGGFNIISDVTMDEYLYQVVPSEMPSSYGVEASKVQAICARTYAYKQYYKGAYEKFGANVDDSTSCQVYNNIGDNEVSVSAVNETSKQIIVKDDKPIDAFFFSTTGGYTASSGDVWTSNLDYFPSQSEPYLTAQSQHSESEVDFTNEEEVSKFFKDKNVDAIEKDVNWFRWDYTLQKDELSTSINNNLQDRYSKRPDLILTKQGDGSFKSQPVDNIGLVKDLQIIERGDGGNVIVMDIIGTEKTIRVYTEYNIRALIRPYQYIPGKSPIVLNMVGQTMSNYSLMPSTFMTIDKTFDENNMIKSITVYGGGNGHSVGLSQNGAKELLEDGMTVESVIEHYYNGSTVAKIGEF